VAAAGTQRLATAMLVEAGVALFLVLPVRAGGAQALDTSGRAEAEKDGGGPGPRGLAGSAPEHGFTRPPDELRRAG